MQWMALPGHELPAKGESVLVIAPHCDDETLGAGGMIAEATRNARDSAEQFARDSGVNVGRLKTASQGYFSVGPRDGEDCDDCGSTGGSTPFQKVRVVTTIDYDLG